MDVLLLSLGISLVMTVVIEFLLSLLWGLRGRDLILVVLMNGMTNPVAVFSYIVLQERIPSLGLVVIIELLVTVAEGICCQTRGENIQHPWRFAAVLNLCSYTIGEIIQWIM